MEQYTLSALGWGNRPLPAADQGTPARVVALHRNRIDLLTPTGALHLPGTDIALAVGDWVLHDGQRVVTLLERRGLLARRVAGADRESEGKHVGAEQVIAANVDTLGIVSSCNADFNPARLERYLALAASAECLPLIILTKADLCDDPRGFLRRAEQLSPLVTAMALDARDPEAVRALDPWCRDGQVLALVGMSGVGKTTLQNALTGTEAATAGIREDDARGRHTTTARSMRRTLAGGWLIDTPGMRGLGLTGGESGLAQVFAEIADLSAQCRFRDCAHQGEPGCAVRAAIEAGDLEEDRLRRWQKLRREETIAAETRAESRQRQKGLQKTYNHGAARGRKKRRGP